ncbi:MAG: hypothetical protein II844_06215 [Prevotella sp.]|nr:hypothetical protein [Prevotella sp.]
MKKILSLAVLLLTLLPVVEVAAQSYGNESYGSNTSCTSQSTGIWCKAQASNADIYTVVYDEDSYEFNDFSDYGDFSQEVVFQDGTRYQYGYDDYNSYSMSSATVGYGGPNGIPLSKYDTSRLSTQHLVVKTNGDYDTTIRRVVKLLQSRTRATGTETAAVSLADGNFVVYKDVGNTWNSSNLYYDKINGVPCFLGEMITNYYHTHPYIDFGNKENPLYVSVEDKKAARNLNLRKIYIVSSNGHLYEVNINNTRDWDLIIY